MAMTLSQFVDALCPDADPEERKRISGRVRHMTSANALQTAERTYTGRGIYRRYPESEVLIAKILNLFASRFGIDIPRLCEMSGSIREAIADYADAKAGHTEGYLLVVQDDHAEWHVVFDGRQMPGLGEADCGIAVDLSKFSQTADQSRSSATVQSRSDRRNRGSHRASRNIQ